MVSDVPDSRSATDNHFALKHFFESELRFSPQFEQLYRIVEEYDRTENPAALGLAFEILREYYKAARKNQEDVILNSDESPTMQRTDNGEQVPCTWG